MEKVYADCGAAPRDGLSYRGAAERRGFTGLYGNRAMMSGMKSKARVENAK